MTHDSVDDARTESYVADDKGRITLGSEYAGDRVRVAVVERIDESESAVPETFPRFSYENVGLSMASESESRREALVSTGSPGDPYWFGTTGAAEAEVGISADEYSQGVLITGKNRATTRTAILSQFEQIVTRGQGAVVYDRGNTERSVEAESPYQAIARECGREEDLHVLDVSSAGGVSYNYLEFDDFSMESPESQELAETIEEVETRVKTLARGFDSDGYWGPLMSRLLRNVLRRAVIEGIDPTLRDVNEVLAGADSNTEIEPPAGRSQRRQEWIDEISEELAEDTDADWEPLLRRLQPWVETPEIRKSIAPSTPTLSLRDAVLDDEIIVITGDDRSQIAQASVGAATILRVFGIVRTSRDRGMDRPSEPFTVLADGFDRVVNAHEEVARGLRSIRAYNVQVVGSAPGLSAFSDPEAVAGGFNTRLTCRLSGENAKREVQDHSRKVTQKELQQLPADVAYLQTDPGAHTPSESIRCKVLRPTVGDP